MLFASSGRRASQARASAAAAEASSPELHPVYIDGGAFIGCKGGPKSAERAFTEASDMCVARRLRSLPGVLCPACTRFLELWIGRVNPEASSAEPSSRPK